MKFRWLVVSVSLLISIYCGVYVRGNVQDVRSLLYFVGATCSTIVLYAMVSNLANRNAVAWLGRSSLVIYGIHGLVANSYQYSIFPNLFETTTDGALRWLMNLTYVMIMASIISIPISKLLKKLTVTNK